MSQPPILPRWPGQAWPIKRSPMTSTRIARHVSGREIRAALFAAPMYQFEITFDGLSSSDAASLGNLAERSLEELQGFYAACGGPLTPFLYVDPVENTALGQPLGFGDGSTTTFPFLRTIGSRGLEPVLWVTAVSAVYVGGVQVGDGSDYVDHGLASQAVSTLADYGPASEGFTTETDYGLASSAVGVSQGWSLAQPASLTLATPPAQGAVVTADFAYAFLCRFSDDTLDLSHDMLGLWSAESVKFQTVR